MMWWNHSWGFGWGWIVVMGVAMVACMAMMARMMRPGGSGGFLRRMGNGDEAAPEQILARRLASGEIDVQEFERLRNALRRTSASPADAAEPSSAERHPAHPDQRAF
jgi:uncharacterized membrane protein